MKGFNEKKERKYRSFRPLIYYNYQQFVSPHDVNGIRKLGL